MERIRSDVKRAVEITYDLMTIPATDAIVSSEYTHLSREHERLNARVELADHFG